MKKCFLHLFNYFFYVFVCVLAIFTSVFCVCFIYLNYTNINEKIKQIFVCIVISVLCVLTVLTICFYRDKIKIGYKLCFLILSFAALITFGFYILYKFGILDKIKSVEDLRKYVDSFGSHAVMLFIFIQFLQVVVLPIPSFLTVGAGVLLFGPLLSAVYSIIGIVFGSVTAFFIGRLFGVKVVKWVIGEDGLNKGLKIIEGKDKTLLTCMFLFPFFPDDLLCFVSGITTVKPLYFTIMILVARTLTVFTACYSLNNSLIPFNTWWGIALWVIFFAITIFLTVLIYKHGEKIEKYIKLRFKKDWKN